MNILHFRFIFFNLKILGEIVTPFLLNMRRFDLNLLHFQSYSNRNFYERK